MAFFRAVCARRQGQSGDFPVFPVVSSDVPRTIMKRDDCGFACPGRFEGFFQFPADSDPEGSGSLFSHSAAPFLNENEWSTTARIRANETRPCGNRKALIFSHPPSNRETVMPNFCRGVSWLPTRLHPFTKQFMLAPADIDRDLPAFAVTPIRFPSVTVARLRRTFTGLPFHNRKFCSGNIASIRVFST